MNHCEIVPEKLFFYLGSQALLACLQHSSSDSNLSKMDHVIAKNLLESVLDDEFLFSLHMHYDLHETVLGRSDTLTLL